MYRQYISPIIFAHELIGPDHDVLTGRAPPSTFLQTWQRLDVKTVWAWRAFSRSFSLLDLNALEIGQKTDTWLLSHTKLGNSRSFLAKKYFIGSICSVVCMWERESVFWMFVRIWLEWGKRRKTRFFQPYFNPSVDPNNIPLSREQTRRSRRSRKIRVTFVRNYMSSFEIATAIVSLLSVFMLVARWPHNKHTFSYGTCSSHSIVHLTEVRKKAAVGDIAYLDGAGGGVRVRGGEVGVVLVRRGAALHGD